jgi:hypothetical protein
MISVIFTVKPLVDFTLVEVTKFFPDDGFQDGKIQEKAILQIDVTY